MNYRKIGYLSVIFASMLGTISLFQNCAQTKSESYIEEDPLVYALSNEDGSQLKASVIRAEEKRYSVIEIDVDSLGSSQPYRIKLALAASDVIRQIRVGDDYIADICSLQSFKQVGCLDKDVVLSAKEYRYADGVLSISSASVVSGKILRIIITHGLVVDIPSPRPPTMGIAKMADGTKKKAPPSPEEPNIDDILRDLEQGGGGGSGGGSSGGSGGGNPPPPPPPDDSPSGGGYTPKSGSCPPGQRCR